MKKYIPLFALLIILAIGAAALSGIFGVRPSKLEEDGRLSHKIDDSWLTAMAEPAGDMAAMIFYSPEKDDFTYSIYVNRPGVSFGYFFRGGGSSAEVEDAIAEFTIEGYVSRAYVSMNAQRIARVEFGNDTALDLDPDKPFAITVPPEWGSVTFYDEDGEWIEQVRRPL